jgi:hypothetical protein
MTKNLETIISKLSFEIVEEIKKSSEKKKLLNLIDKSLGVLANNGVYAYYVYIISQKSQETEGIFIDKLEDIFKKVEDSFSKDNKQEYFEKVSEDIHKLLFLKQLLEKTLIYARYHAKAMGD